MNAMDEEIAAVVHVRAAIGQETEIQLIRHSTTLEAYSR